MYKIFMEDDAWLEDGCFCCCISELIAVPSADKDDCTFVIIEEDSAAVSLSVFGGTGGSMTVAFVRPVSAEDSLRLSEDSGPSLNTRIKPTDLETTMTQTSRTATFPRERQPRRDSRTTGGLLSRNDDGAPPSVIVIALFFFESPIYSFSITSIETFAFYPLRSSQNFSIIKRLKQVRCSCAPALSSSCHHGVVGGGRCPKKCEK
jgi:hypothetical protein